jgi:hypothetical protein
MELIQTFQSGSVLGMEEFFNSLTSTLGIPVHKKTNSYRGAVTFA